MTFYWMVILLKKMISIDICKRLSSNTKSRNGNMISPERTVKALLLHNGNNYASVSIGHFIQYITISRKAMKV